MLLAFLWLRAGVFSLVALMFKFFLQRKLESSSLVALIFEDVSPIEAEVFIRLWGVSCVRMH